MSALSFARGSTDTPLLADTIDGNLRKTIAAWPDRDAIVDLGQGTRLTYAQVDVRVEELARGLVARGVNKGDRVGIWAPNLLEWYLVQFATARIGAILVTINPAYRTHELAYVLKQAGVTLLVAAVEFKGSNYRSMIDEVRPDIETLRDVVYINDPSWDQLVAGGADIAPAEMAVLTADQSNEEPINLQYTSGTTGFPKGATLSHRNILNNAYFFGEILGYTEQDRICVPVPFYHCFGMVSGNLAATSRGACIVIPAPGFDPGLTLQAVEKERCTSLYGVPTMFIAELALPNFATYDLSSLRTGIIGGSACPAEVMKRVIDEMHMTEVTIGYGMTETSPISTQTRVDDEFDKRVNTAGRAHPHVEVKVVDPVSGDTVPPGTPGEFCTRGYSVMLGYWNDPERTAETVRDGWIHTGDLATMDEDGYLSIVGRIKDLVIRGGENIYPREIEEFLHTHPDIIDAQVVGVPDDYYGEELMAWVRLREGAALDAAALKDFCAGTVAHYKIPRYVHSVDEFPMTVTGKIRKSEMREESIRLLGL